MAALYVITPAGSRCGCISSIKSRAHCHCLPCSQALMGTQDGPRCHCLPCPQALIVALHVIRFAWIP